MIEIKFQGKGGQGVVVASEILARACFEDDMYPQCYSLFGGERRGAPVSAFVRVSDRKIYLKCDIDHPNHLVLFDAALASEQKIIQHVASGGFLLLNGAALPRRDTLKSYTVGAINALEIAKNNGLGPLVNTAILGAYVRLTNIVSLDILTGVIEEHVPAAAGKNIAAAKEAYEKLCIL
jgi:2-oxoacid:acceptor oxidoreductase gamma subunit (pyruvate/2-ketoisovalerate family)